MALSVKTTTRRVAWMSRAVSIGQYEDGIICLKQQPFSQLPGLVAYLDACPGSHPDSVY
jgi:hypothetical protein